MIELPTFEDLGLTGLAPTAEMVVGLCILAALAWLGNFVAKKIILRILIARVLPQDGPSPRKVVAYLANIVPTVIVAYGVGAVPHLAPGIASVIANVANGVTILVIAMAISAALSFVNALYEQRPESASRPIKGYVQVLKIVVYSGAAILIVAVLIEQSPLLLLSGLGAMAAVVLLVFKDTILSLVASVQLTSNDLLRVGDWIEMPQAGADGDVIDIALHTVKVQNFDKTIVSIPTHRLISESYRNWRGMSESGGRRIKRPIFIDQNSIRFLEAEEIARLKRVALIADYLADKERELGEWNAGLGEAGREAVNARRATNVGTFRAYVLAYLRAHPRVSPAMTLMVRQREPGPQGLPLEIYCFTDTTAWLEYERIQSDIFDHLLAILPEFGLRIFQQPSGLDFRTLAEG
ncbi:mechanosensitive ion channel [Altererythrobacter marinus]|jgi:miniconductance mechanosensitive channel|uniref:Mechanosensitive ion channel n=1 Tax=Pelagerythrobacter marinus TaxID=538382 RepID=A0ABW9UWM0_9SPHN|nr:mechanosensitive ion channel family protein [Pelagerythrobacter marinus]MXO67970.1 mechanosensitive ion channel [Pelagerythrobacter marinus]